MIGNGNEYAPRPGRFRRDDDVAFRSRASSHRVDRVPSQVEEHLLELDGVRAHPRKAGRSAHAHRGTFGTCVQAGKRVLQRVDDVMTLIERLASRRIALQVAVMPRAVQLGH